MEAYPAQNRLSPFQFMNSLSSKLRPPLLLRASTTAAATFKPFSAAPLTLTTASPPPAPEDNSVVVPSEPPIRRNSRKKNANNAVSQAQLRGNWLDSLSCPFPPENGKEILSSDPNGVANAASEWVIGIDPDVSGAVALLKPDESAQVFDSPHLKVLIGGRARKRLDAKSIVQLLRSFDAPMGTTAYLEQSIPYPKDGKQGWWSGGFGYGLWIGVLVASGFSVVPVPSLVWKNEFKLSGSKFSKDDSRELASAIFPSMTSLLKRKKDHGRAEALLIAAYGKGLKLDSNCSSLDDKQSPVISRL
ncbi:hypothetical protein M9H77_13881 [Catharanthus roseus]|uniref:Uncharacterized protein n=1 Tax=Catharanthus roseus TaxID=4058 RepID=A0ACC0BLM9_CATRO|nr:hypothetical protein M9H77_13881 [Catharanthus roseus]